MTDKTDFTVRVRPDLDEQERQVLIRSADIVAERVAKNEEVRVAVVKLLKHQYEAIADDFKIDKDDVTIDEAGRRDEQTRYTMYGVDEVADLLTNPAKLTELRSVLNEHGRKQ